MKHSLKALVTGCAATALLAAGMSSAAAEDLKVGVIVPLTGTNAVQGEDILRGIQLAIKRVNAGYEVPMKDGSTVSVSPDTLGGTIVLKSGDTESRPNSALEAVRKLVNVDKVPMVLGVLSSGICVPTGKYTNENKVVQISNSCTSPELRDIGPYFFNVMGLDDLMGKALGDFAYKDSGASKYGSLVANNPFGVGMEIESCKQLEALGAECVNHVRYDENKSDYRPDLTRTLSKGAEVGLITAYGTDARLLLQQAYQQGIVPEKGWYADYPSLWFNEIGETPEVGEGIKGLEPGTDPEFYANEYEQAYTDEFGEKPVTVFGAYAYDSAMIGMLAIHAADTFDADALRDNIRAVAENYQGITGDKSLDEDGMLVSAEFRPVIYTDGKLVDYEIESD